MICSIVWRAASKGGVGVGDELMSDERVGAQLMCVTRLSRAFQTTETRLVSGTTF